MSLERAPLEPDTHAPQQSWLACLIAFIAHLFDQIARMKRIRHTTRFKPTWRDHFAGLRQCEWMRDQVLAAGAACLLAGKPLDLRDFIASIEPPADYGGPCPRTPQLMNRRFLAVAHFNANPEAAIRTHAQRIAKRARAANGSTGAWLRHAAHHEAGVGCETGTLPPLMVSSAQPGATAHARGPPQSPQNQHSPPRSYLREYAPMPAP